MRWKKEQISGSEYLSRFRKEDKLVPVITAVFHYGADEWDGSTDLYSMFAENPLVLVRYMKEHGEYFQHVDSGTYYAIGELLQSKRILNKEVKRSETGGEMDMCKALEDLYQDGCAKGREEGRESKLRELVDKKLQKGYSVSEIADMLEEEESVIEAIVDAGANR